MNPEATRTSSATNGLPTTDTDLLLLIRTRVRI